MNDLQPHPTIHGRGTAFNPKNRFEKLEITFDPDTIDAGDYAPDLEYRPKTEFLIDHSRSFITYNKSPDIPFAAGINPYRGCEHGCVYCFARPTHEYLGFGSGIDFETKIMVKLSAPELLRLELSAKKYVPQALTLSAITDVYQPLERQLKLTRKVLEVLLEFRNPVVIITKNHLVTRDTDILSELAKLNAASVAISLTSLDEDLRRKLEPRTSTAKRRLHAIETLANAGVRVGVMNAPIIPGLTDHEIPALVKAAVDAGASFAHYGLLRLPHSNTTLFTDWLERHYPDRKEKVLNRLKAMHNGELNDSRFGHRMRGEGIFAEQIKLLHRAACRQAKLERTDFKLETKHFRVPRDQAQASLFDFNDV
jgi:DNA repair photolyase